MTIRNLTEANAALLQYVPASGVLTMKDTTLERVAPLMELLGNPQDKLRVIHIAGTSGKTSTAYYMSALLAASGKKVGLTVSPHIDSVAERVQINGQPLDEVTFCAELAEFLSIVERLSQAPTYFETVYCFALWEFARQQVDYAVVETGVGGLFDATNIVTRADKVCVITDIGFDHMHLLGNTLSDIAAQKIGIVHQGNVTFTYQQSPEVMEVFTRWVDEHRATLQIVDASHDMQLEASGMPAYQKRNWALAYQVYDYLSARDGLEHATHKVLQQTQLVQVPGRMDRATVNGKTIIMDGAHNAQKLQAFVSSFQQLYPDTKPVVLLALKDSKEVVTVAPFIRSLASEVVVTKFNTSQDLPVRSMDVEQLVGALQAAGLEQVTGIEDNVEAFTVFTAKIQKIGVILGSFYLLSQLRSNADLHLVT